ncbi:MAG: hypothetical protein EBQ96_07800 [Proteobacteria bacterium]|nr:hypothetical protein [Pseudomonadota bacterium]
MMLAEKLSILSDVPDIKLSEGAMDAPLRAAVTRMLEWCARTPAGAAFMARGLVIDTMGDIAAQVTSYFPAHVNVTPVLDDVSFVVAEAAQKSGQRFQEIALDYIGDGKIPEAARANMQTFVKWYGVEAAVGGDFEGNHKKLRPGWSGGAGTPTDMLKYLNLGTKKGFLLQVCALDIADARAQSLLADMPLMQAFGGSPAAISAAVEAIEAKGPQAEAIKTLANLVAEIKTIKAALTNAADTPQAAPLAAALALKTETLIALVPSLKAAPAVKAEVTRSVEAIKTDLQARQVTSVVETIIRHMPPALVARTANDVAGPAAVPIQAARAIEALSVAAKVADMSVREAVHLTLTKEAPPAIKEAVATLSRVLATPEFLPVMDRVLPPAAAVQVRVALTQPVLESVSAQPVAVKALVQSIEKTVIPALPPQSPILPTITLATRAIEQTSVSSPVLRAGTLQAAADNLQALGMTRAIPPEAKPMLVVAQAQIEAAVMQTKAPQPALPSAPAVLPPVSTLSVLARAVDVVPPAIIPPAAPFVIRASQPAEFMPAAKAPVLNTRAESPVAKAASSMTKPDAKEAKKEKEAAKGPCPNCTKGFNCAACSALTDAAIAKMDALMGLKPADIKAEVRPKVA